MSPLACSLLALSALLAVATAIPNPDCGFGISLGTTGGDDFIHYKVITGEGRLKIHDKCSRPGRSLVGVAVTPACDPNSGKPSAYQVLTIDFTLLQVDIRCPHQCSEYIEVDIIQYCGAEE